MAKPCTFLAIIDQQPVWFETHAIDADDALAMIEAAYVGSVQIVLFRHV